MAWITIMDTQDWCSFLFPTQKPRPHYMIFGILPSPKLGWVTHKNHSYLEDASNDPDESQAQNWISNLPDFQCAGGDVDRATANGSRHWCSRNIKEAKWSSRAAVAEPRQEIEKWFCEVSWAVHSCFVVLIKVCLEKSCLSYSGFQTISAPPRSQIKKLGHK